ncbi:hypothetical protein BaRGS_00001831 [Batillaria attramentaria]|uniref:FERM domain-containing protein n=1 Tax=Batillaria attramentaria TaxID=370345 RepID=A0ABD0M5H8_9CAEN
MSSVNGAVSPGSKNKRKVVNVVLLHGEELLVHVDVKGKLYEVFNQVAAHLSLRETEYFGLAFLRDEEYQFLVLDEKISKIAPKKWKTGPGEGFDSEDKPLLTLWFRVQFYVDQVVLLREKVTRHLYYLQLKENVLKYNHLYSEEKCFQLVGYALQADYGNYIPEKHTAGYFDPRQYFPAWILEKRGVTYLQDNCPLVHRDLHNVTRTDAELKYIREGSSPPGAHNLHFYRVRKKKTDKACNTWLAICARGVEVYEDDAGFKNLISTFLWPDIGKLYFDKKKFEIRSVGSAGGRRFTYYTESDVTSKYLLYICRSTHMFQMAIHPKLMEIRHLDAEDKKRYRESYIYSDARDLVANGGPVQYRASRSPGKSPAGTQRYSVISDVSSNTTSGIVSDKMAISFDEGEEHSKEIIIDCPPRQSLHGTPGQSRTKMPLMGSYKMTPPTPGSRSPALPPQSLELFRTPGSSGKGSPASPHLQELSPASSTGSYRAKLQQTTHSMFAAVGKTQPYGAPTPSPSSPGQPYAISSSASSSPREWGDVPSVARNASRKESFKSLQGPMLVTLDRNVSGDSTTTSGSTASTGVVALSVENSPVTQPAHVCAGVGQYPSSPMTGSPSFSFGSHAPASFAQAQAVSGGAVQYPVDKSLSPKTGAVMLPLMSRLTVPDTSPPLHHLPHAEHLYTDRSDQLSVTPQEHLYTDRSDHLQTTPAEHLYTDRSDHLTPAAAEHVYTDRGDAAGAEPLEVLAPPAAFADTHSCGDAVGNLPLAQHTDPQASVQLAPSHSSHSSGVAASSSSSDYVQVHGGSTDSGNVLSDCSSVHHSAQSSEEDSGMKDAYSDLSASRKTSAQKTGPQKSRAGKKGMGKAKHVSVKNQKEALHPELEEILGQSHAHSLPFITALCNDLMTGSAHSSVGSHDTLRSNDSHPDSRRWSTCGPMESSVVSDSGSILPGTMLVVGSGARPYSWHSEHFDLDASLSAVPQRKAVPRHQHPPQHHQLDNHRSVPHELYACSGTAGATSVLWTQAIANSSSAPYGGSLDRYSPELIAQQLMIPSRLTSGGHSGTDGNISHHKTLKENIGIA